jgi:hypothetical protein
MKQFNKIEKLDPKKSSRYGFACFLINIKYILGEDVLLKVYERYRAKENEPFSSKNDKSSQYLKHRMPTYVQAFSAMIQGNIEQSLEMIYDFEDFKQTTYRNQGIKKAKGYEQQIQRLIAQADLQL